MQNFVVVPLLVRIEVRVSRLNCDGKRVSEMGPGFPDFSHARVVVESFPFGSGANTILEFCLKIDKWRTT